ncbi:conserved hypothetical protein [Rubrivivax sp. A210]|uniref:hypothetical protein n=1 Tax=Rubrivivax sp. A210 TaxID=2772301 RepID=UPI00191AE16E|nr:hypothetical protein [Rubrivivax sp. A210]CAD5372273.1 conserved hypothetical protein [Rubrivivax sp. A210]
MITAEGSVAGAPIAWAPDYAALREQGLALVQRLAGREWTDHNAHDPGITILEQLCYALTDLAYRAGWDVPDLLAGGGGDPYASLATPAQALPTSPVTLTDLRKLVLDVPGVKNAWIAVVDEAQARFDAADGEISAMAGAPGASASPNVSEIHLRGLLRVQIEKSSLVDIDGGLIRREATRRLLRCRGLCQDFESIQVLEDQPIRLAATLEIGAVADATALLARVYQAIASYLSPTVPFHSLAEMLARGRRVDEIFEGPPLEHGFIDTEEMSAVERRSSVRISDLIRALMAVHGIEAVKSLHFLGAGGPLRDWLLSVDEGRVPRFNLQDSDIRLERRGLRVDQGIQAAARRLYAELGLAASPAPIAAAERDLRPRPGRDRDAASYFPVQQQFPLAWGIGAAGLADSAPPERRAQARQLKAYLMFFEQILANEFAQLGGVARLFSVHDETPDSYFSQPVPDSGALGLEAIRRPRPAAERAALLQAITEDPWQARSARAGLERRDRFLDHLLARHGEQFRDYALLQAGAWGEDGDPLAERMARDKRAFLRDWPRIARTRGSAFDYLQPAGDDNLGGLELGLRRKLGIATAEERFHLVEHILLRPLAGDLAQRGPLLRAAASRDPYSLQFSLVFPDWPARYQDANFRQFVEQTVREETPAHLTAHLIWLDRPAMQAFEAAHAQWLAQWRSHRLADLGL